MKIVTSNIGIKNVTDYKIRELSNIENKHRDSASRVWYSQDYAPARLLFVKRFLSQKLKYRPNEILIKNVRMCQKGESGILWFESHPGLVKNMFIRASQLQDPSIQLIQFTPGEAVKRFRGIKDICGQIRAKDPENIRTQIRPGREDFEVFVKHIKPFVYTPYVRHTVSELDPENQLEEFKLKKMDDKEMAGYFNAIRTAVEQEEKE